MATLTPTPNPGGAPSLPQPTVVTQTPAPQQSLQPALPALSPYSLLPIFGFFVAAYVFNDVLSGVAMWRMPKPADPTGVHPTLPDLGFDIFPYPTLPSLPTGILLVSMGASFLLALSLGLSTARVILIRFMVIDGILLCLRGVTIVSTSMNNPDPRCANCGGTCPTTVWGCIFLTLSKFPFFSCGDLMFSGHTVHYILMALIWTTYYKGPWGNNVLPLYWIVSAFGVTTLLSMRYHYSIDVLVATALTTITWVAYHVIALNYLPLVSRMVRTPRHAALADDIVVVTDRQLSWPVRAIARVEAMLLKDELTLW